MSITEGDAAAEMGWTADDSTFGARLALIRNKMGWGNIAKAAKECGLPVDSWRNWEVDGREPHRRDTIAMTIATRSGCDFRWLVHGPDRGERRVPSGRYGRARVLVRAGSAGQMTTPQPTSRQTSPLAHIRPVRQSPMIGGQARRPVTAGAL